MPEILTSGAGNLDINFQIGSARSITYAFDHTDSDGNTVDISTWTFEFFIKKFKGDRVKLVSLTLSSGISFPVYQDNDITVSFSSTNTKQEEGQYYYELRRTDANLPLFYGWATFSFDPQ